MRMVVLAWLALLSAQAMAQSDTLGKSSSEPTGRISCRNLDRLGSEYSSLSASVQQQSLRVLTRLQRQELKMQRQLQSKDSVAATQVFKGAAEQYQQWKVRLTSAVGTADKYPLKEYLPGIDSVSTALQFLRTNKLSSLSAGQLQSIQSADSRLVNLQNQLQQANNIQSFIQQRQQMLQTQLQQYGMAKQLLTYKQQAYYYRAQLQSWKESLKDPDAMANKVLAIVRNSSPFQHFFQNNSYLSSLFNLPGSNSNAAAGTAISGLQTKDMVASLVQAKMGPGASLGAAATATSAGSGGEDNPLTASMQQAQGLINTWKAKVVQSGGSSSDAPVADFQPNSQHNKTFLKRIQIGFDMQSQQSSALIPAVSTLGLNIGYKLSDRTILGVGGAYILGWGQPFDHIAMSSQGASVRSSFNWRWKGSLWLSGGYEANYLNAFAHLSQLNNIDAWQRSALIGLMKQYKVGKTNANMQLLFDMLYQQHIPQSQPILFRFGYSFN